MTDAAITPAGLRLIKLLVGRSPIPVLTLMRKLRVTRTAVTEQLHDLLAAGFVERKIEHLPGREHARCRLERRRARHEKERPVRRHLHGRDARGPGVCRPSDSSGSSQ